MPVYVFTCPACGRFEESRPMARAGDRASCPTCRGEARRGGVAAPPHPAPPGRRCATGAVGGGDQRARAARRPGEARTADAAAGDLADTLMGALRALTTEITIGSDHVRSDGDVARRSVAVRRGRPRRERDLADWAGARGGGRAGTRPG